MHLNEEELSVNEEDKVNLSDSSFEEALKYFNKILHLYFSPSTVEKCISIFLQTIREFWHSQNKRTIYFYSAEDSTLSCSLQRNFNPALAHIYFTNSKIDGSVVENAFMFHWIPANSTLQSAFESFNEEFISYLQSFIEYNLENEQKSVKHFSSISKRLKEIEFEMSYLCHIHNIPHLPRLTIPACIEELYVRNASNIETFLDSFELEQPKDLISEILNCVSGWTVEIQSLTKFIKRTLAFDSISAELVFWNQYESRLFELQEMLKNSKIQFSLELLKRAKKFHVTMGFFNDCGLQEAIDYVNQKKVISRDLPLEKLFSARNWDDLQHFVNELFNQIGKKGKGQNFPVDLLIQFMDSLSMEFIAKILYVCNSFSGEQELNLNAIEEARNLLLEWEFKMKEVQTQLRDLVRKKTGKFSCLKFSGKFQDFFNVFDKFFGVFSEYSSIQKTYMLLKNDCCDIFDIEIEDYLKKLAGLFQLEKSKMSNLFSIDFEETAKAIISSYAEIVNDLDDKLVRIIKSIIDNNDDIENIINIFKKYNFFMKRPAVHSELSCCITNVLKHFRNEIALVQDKIVKSKKATSIFAFREFFHNQRNILFEINSISKNINDVLGDDWGFQQDYLYLHSEIITMEKKINLELLADEWISFLREKMVTFVGPIFEYDTINCKCNLTFDFEQTVCINDSILYLLDLNFIVPLDLMSFQKEYERIFPYANRLFKIINDFNQINLEMGSNKDFFSSLLADVNQKFVSGLKLKWEACVKYTSKTQLASNRYCLYIDSLDSSLQILKQKYSEYCRLLLLVSDLLCRLDMNVEISIVSTLLDALYQINEFNQNFVRKNLVSMLQKLFVHIFCPDSISAKSCIRISPNISIPFLCNYLLISCLNTTLNEENLQILHLTVDFLNESPSIINLIQREFLQFSTMLSFQLDTLQLIKENHYLQITEILQFSNFLENDFCKRFMSFSTQERIQIYDQLSAFNDNSIPESIELRRNIFLDFNPIKKSITLAVRKYLAEMKEPYIEAIETEKDAFLSKLLSNNELKNSLEFFSKYFYMTSNEEQIRQKFNFLHDRTADKTSFEKSFIEALNFLSHHNSSEIEKEFRIAVDQSSQNLLNSFDSLRPRLVFYKKEHSEVEKIIQMLKKDSLVINEVADVAKSLQSLIKANEMHISHSVNFQDISDLIVEFKEIQSIWIFIETLQSKLVHFLSSKIAETSSKAIISFIKTLISSLHSFVYNGKFSNLIDNYQNRLMNVCKLSILIDELQDEKLIAKVKESISELINDANCFDSAAKLLLNENVEHNFSKIKSLILGANGECTVENSLIDLKSAFSTLSIDFALYNENSITNDSFFVITNYKLLHDKIIELLTSLESMKLSIYAKKYENQRLSLENSMNFTVETLLKLQNLQKTLLHLTKYFSCNPLMQKKLPYENSKFQQNLSNFQQIIEMLKSSQQPMKCFSDDSRVIQLINDVFEANESIQESLTRLLDHARDDFYLFYFLNDEDLMKIFCFKSPMDGLAFVLPKLFPSIKGIITESSCSANDKISITGIESVEEERVYFLKQIEASEFSVSLIRLVQDEIYLSLKSLFLSNYKKYVALFLEQELFIFEDNLPFQTCQLILQVSFTESLKNTIKLQQLKEYLHLLSNHFYDRIVDKNAYSQRKFQNLLLEINRQLVELDWVLSGDSKKEFELRLGCCLRFEVVKSISEHQASYGNTTEFESKSNVNVSNKTKNDFEVVIRMRNFSLTYGFEYLGVYEKIVDTPIVCHFSRVMVAALSCCYGGSPFGPAGTGKTEAVKSLGHLLGKQVYVFNCNENFNFSSISRIMKGLLLIGSWGCFDEINRLELTNLSAIANLLVEIQQAFREKYIQLSQGNNSFPLNRNCAFFITQNPAYKGRVQLPANLSLLFRSFCMSKPDVQDIINGLFLLEGIQDTKLAETFVKFFTECTISISQKDHYDFGLRAMKTVMKSVCKKKNACSENTESKLLLLASSIYSTIAARLYHEDYLIFGLLLEKYFNFHPSLLGSHQSSDYKTVFESKNFSPFISFDRLALIDDTVNSYDGIIFYGRSATGKSSYFKAYLDVFHSGNDTIYHIDPSILTLSQLIGSFDEITQKWKDGIIPTLFRTIHENSKESFSWIHFDGLAFSAWMENFNSLFDENRILTLPNGENIPLPRNLKFIIETDRIDLLTKATFTRFGFVFFDASIRSNHSSKSLAFSLSMPNIALFEERIEKLLNWLELINFNPCLDLEKSSFLLNFQKILNSLSEDNMYLFALFHSLYNLLDSELKFQFIEFFDATFGPFDSFKSSAFFIENVYDWKEKKFIKLIAASKVEHSCVESTLVPTIESMRWEYLVYLLVNNSSAPILLCGPSGSGKTMTILNFLQSATVQANFDTCLINFSKNSTLDSFLKVLLSRCKFIKRSSKETILVPHYSSNLVVFIDEVNLPQLDSLGNVPVISLLRFIMEYNGFYYANDWITLKNVKFIFACNPTSDPGRIPLTRRFLRKCCVFWVGHPEKDSLLEIYSTILYDSLRQFPLLRNKFEFYAQTMVEFYFEMKQTFSSSVQTHYVFSTRDLSKWSTGFSSLLHEVSQGSPSIQVTDEILCRIFIYEGCRVFLDRLVDLESKKKACSLLQKVTGGLFSKQIDPLPLWFSDWNSNGVTECTITSLLPSLQQKMTQFMEENDNCYRTPFVPCDDLLHRILRIDRILKRPLGHLLMMGNIGIGKSFCVKFTCWLNGISLFSIAAHSNFSLEMFDFELRKALRKVILTETPVCFYIDCISHQISMSFLERINVILANGEIFDIFEEEQLIELSQNITAEIMRSRVCKYFHAIISMSPPNNEEEMKDSMCASPAIFTRCLIDWTGNWTTSSIHTTVQAIISKTDIFNPNEFAKSIVSPLYFEGKLHSPSDLIMLCHIFVHEYTISRELLINEHIRSSNGLNLLTNCKQSTSQLSKEMRAYKSRLEEKKSSCDKKLSEMVEKQRQSEHEKLICDKLKEELQQRQQQISQRTAQVQNQLAEITPLVEEAKSSVKEIKKQHLVELRSLNNPPESIKLTLEAVCLLLQEKFDTWKSIQNIVRKDDFIGNVVNFSSKLLSPSSSVISRLRTQYIENASFSFETVNYASKACGPLVRWVLAQVKYIEILDHVSPLNEEINELQHATEKNKFLLLETEGRIEQLLHEIDQIKSDYSVQLEEMFSIKTAYESVSQKLNKSEVLIGSLHEEQDRWDCSIDEYKEKLRELPLLVWNEISSIYTNQQFKIIKNPKLFKLCSFSQEVTDKISSLLFYSNHSVIPFIVENSSSEKTILILQEFYYPKKIQVISFCSPSWIKTLENALTFGNILLIKDAHRYDSILNKLILEEFSMLGSKKTLTIEISNEYSQKPVTKTIQVSPNFKLFLYAKRRPTLPFLINYTKVVDFTCSSIDSIKLTCLDVALKKTDISLFERKFSTLASVNSLKESLMETESELLNLLSRTEIVSENVDLEQTDISNSLQSESLILQKNLIIDDDNLINALTKCKQESSKLNIDLANSLNIIKEIDHLSAKYDLLCLNFALFFNKILFCTDINPQQSIFDIIALTSLFSAEFDENLIVMLKRIHFCISASLSQDNSQILILFIQDIFFKSSSLTKSVLYEDYIENEIGKAQFHKPSLFDSLIEVIAASCFTLILNVQNDLSFLINEVVLHTSEDIPSKNVIFHSVGKKLSKFDYDKEIEQLLSKKSLIVLKNCQLDAVFCRKLIEKSEEIQHARVLFLTSDSYNFELIDLLRTVSAERKSSIIYHESGNEIDTFIVRNSWKSTIMQQAVNFHNCFNFKNQYFPFGGFLSQYEISQEDLEFLHLLIQESNVSFHDLRFLLMQFIYKPILESFYDSVVMEYLLHAMENIELEEFQSLTKQSVLFVEFLSKKALHFWEVVENNLKVEICDNSHCQQIIREDAVTFPKDLHSLLYSFQYRDNNVKRQQFPFLSLNNSSTGSLQLYGRNINESLIPTQLVSSSDLKFQLSISWNQFNPAIHRLIPIRINNAQSENSCNFNNYLIVATNSSTPNYFINCYFY